MLPVVIFEPDDGTRVYLSQSVADYTRNHDTNMSLIANTASAEETVRWLNHEEGIMLAMLSVVTGKSECRKQAIQLGQRVFHKNRDNYTLFCLHDAKDLETLLNTGLRPVGVLVKPFGKEKLEKLLTRIDRDFREMHEEEIGDCLIVDSGNSTYRIPYSRILYIEALDKKLIIWTKKQSVSIRMTLGMLDMLLPPERFFRCHRSYIVNLKAIESVDFTSMEVILTSGDSIPLSRTAKDGMRDMLEKEREHFHET